MQKTISNRVRLVFSYFPYCISFCKYRADYIKMNFSADEFAVSVENISLIDYFALSNDVLMLMQFFLKYTTRYGQNISLNIKLSDRVLSLPMKYHNEQYWMLDLDTTIVSDVDQIEYYYEILDGTNSFRDLCHQRSISLKKNQAKRLVIHDDWQGKPMPNDVFKSRALDMLCSQSEKSNYSNAYHTGKHIFKVKTNRLRNGMVLCMLGSGKVLNNWSEVAPLKMRLEGELWILELSNPEAQELVEYKYGVYDIQASRFVGYENFDGNRTFRRLEENDAACMYHQFSDCTNGVWKSSGINVQVTSLKSEHSWGVGDFSDLKMLVDWANKTGNSMLQLLPINDTTVNGSRKDSYPYSAISAFAQHPIFLDVKLLADQYKILLPDSFTIEAKQLNELSTLDYEASLSLKIRSIQLVFDSVKDIFQQVKEYQHFFRQHKSWLQPYALFCVLRDKYKTADYSQWKDYKISPSKTNLEKLFEKKSPYCQQLNFYLFVQYNLHQQLTSVVDYAHENGVIIKGDLPIGVGRYSVETWLNPELFHLDMQAGAPPDAFAVKGQNWSFPTYNWEKMKEDGYRWWRSRMQHMSHYFDATRVDHVLGFFRIWSIPLDAVEGIFGYFVPAIPLTADDFVRKGVHFDADRYCLPYITKERIQQHFGIHSNWVNKHVFEHGTIKEGFSTQLAIEHYDVKHQLDPDIKRLLFDLLSDVILLQDRDRKDAFHFRIDMQKTVSFQKLSDSEKHILNEMYLDYFYRKQNNLWHQTASVKLDAIQKGSDMLICAEDLGMVPEMVEQVLQEREMLALQVQRMPKKQHQQFAMPSEAPYLTVVTPSTHDMSTIRQWWEEDRMVSQQYFEQVLGQKGAAPYFAESWICKKIIEQHLNSPAMWSVFLLQDVLSMSDALRRQDPHQERINIPADPNHYWNYRMHITIEQLLQSDEFNKSFNRMILDSGRA